MSTENEKIVILTPLTGSVYSYSWSRMKKHFLDLFLITIIVAAVFIPFTMIQSLDGHETPGGVLVRIFSFGYRVHPSRCPRSYLGLPVDLVLSFP